MSAEQTFSQVPGTQECPKQCMPQPEPDSGGSPDGEGPNEISSEYPNVREIHSSNNPAEAIARQFNMDQNQFSQLDYEKDLASVTCACGHGYFKPDKTWISGADVRAGLAPSKSSGWS